MPSIQVLTHLQSLSAPLLDPTCTLSRTVSLSYIHNCKAPIHISAHLHTCTDTPIRTVQLSTHLQTCTDTPIQTHMSMPFTHLPTVHTFTPNTSKQPHHTPLCTHHHTLTCTCTHTPTQHLPTSYSRHSCLKFPPQTFPHNTQNSLLKI